MATSSIQAFGGSAMNGGVNINDVRKLIFYHNDEHIPFAVYDPINDNDDTAVSVQEVPDARLVPPLNAQYNGDVLMCHGTPNPSRVWMPIVMCSEGSGGQGVNQFTAARYNAVGAFGTKGNCQLATEYDLDHSIVRFQPKIARVDKNPYTGDIFPRVIDQYTEILHPDTLLSKILVGKPYPICDFVIDKRDYAELTPDGSTISYVDPAMAWRRVYIDVDVVITGFVIFDRFSANNNQIGALYEVNGDSLSGIKTNSDFTSNVTGELDDGYISPNNVISISHSTSIFAHEYILNNSEKLTLEAGKNYLFPVISKPDNHLSSGGPECIFYKHAWPATPSSEKWSDTLGVPRREYNPSEAIFKAPVLQLVLEDGNGVFI